MLVKVPAVGQLGVIKDLSAHEVPPNAWTYANNIRFLDGMAGSAYGYGATYGTPSTTPYNVCQVLVGGSPYWIYAGAIKLYAVNTTGGTTTHTDLTGATAPTAGGINKWTSTVLGGIPVLTNGTDIPQYWDLNIANKFANLSNWTANTYCKSLRAYKNYLVALNITKTTTKYPFLVKWSHPADPGSLPSSWDITDATKDAGEADLPVGNDEIIDGLALRDTFLIYKANSTWRMDFTGGQFVFRFSKVNDSGLMAKNCMAEINGMHICLTKSDVVLNDGASPAVSILDKNTRRFLFAQIDADYSSTCFVFTNPYLNEAFICYPEPGQTSPNKALVYNWVDKTTSFRDLPTIYHAAYGIVDATGSSSWASDSEAWDTDTTLWGTPSYTPDSVRVLMACNGPNLYTLDATATAAGTTITATLERQGLSFGAPESIKLVKGIRPRIYGTSGTVNVSVGSADDPYMTPTYGTAVPFTIGSTVACDMLHSGRYISVKFETGTSAVWRLDSYDMDVMSGGMW